jgi:Mrp family chromosome partitioning ATPase/capsular polysaccharide biosynthesis protein
VLNTSSNDWDEGPSLLESIWRFRWLVLPAVLLGALAGYGLAIRQPPQYEAVGRIFLSAPGQRTVPGAESAPAMDPDRYVRNQAQFMTSAPVISRAAEISGLRQATWRKKLEVVPTKDQDLIVIRVRAGTTSEATKLVDSVAIAYQQVLARQARDEIASATERLTATTDKLRANLDELNVKLQTSPGDPVLQARRDATVEQLKAIAGEGVRVGVDATLGEGAIRVREKATTDGVPVEPRPKRTAAAGGLVGLFAASGLAWWLNHGRRRSRPRDDAADAPRGDDAVSPDAGAGDGWGLEPGDARSLPGEHTPVLGEIPRFSEIEVDGPVPAATAPQSAAAKSYRFIARLIEIASRETHLAAVLITSPEPGDGKTVTTLNLAIAAAGMRERIVVVDGDQRHRDLSRLCQIDGGAGLSDLVYDPGGTEAGQCVWLSEFPGIQVVPAGTPVRDRSEVFRMPSLGAAMSRIQEYADLVLVDTPALSVGPDALALANHVDAAILVVTPESSVGVLRAERQRLDSVGVPVLGYVVNGGAAPDRVRLQDNGSSIARPSVLRTGTDTGIG